MRNLPLRRALLVLAAIAVLAILGGLFALIAGIGDDEPKPPPAKTVTLGGPGHKTVTLPPAAQAIVKDAQADDSKPPPASGVGDTESNLNAPDPPPAVIDASQDLQPPGQPDVPANVPLAAANVQGCTTRLVRNYSSRRGAPVLLGVIHWTGSRPTPGSPASGLAIVSWFDQPAAQASSNEITDQDGRCWLTVAESQKPWTNAQYNPWSVTVEIVNQGVQPLFQNTRARGAVLGLMRGWHARWKLPYRRAVVTQNGCRVVRSGFIDHKALGSCGGGHPDVGAFNLDALIREAAQADNCTAKCRRAQDLRTRLSATVKELRRRNCAPPATTRSDRCKTLHRRRAAIHAAGRRDGVKF